MPRDNFGAQNSYLAHSGVGSSSVFPKMKVVASLVA
jgi:hypothetical protein